MFQVAVLPGPGADTPFLMSKELLRLLGAVVDLETDTITFRTLQDVKLRMGVTDKGHYICCSSVLSSRARSAEARSDVRGAVSSSPI